MYDENSENPCSTSRAHATNEGVGPECRDGEKGPMHACRRGPVLLSRVFEVKMLKISNW
jgi:hypothetical protein